jgi:hypothetical protein
MRMNRGHETWGSDQGGQFIDFGDPVIPAFLAITRGCGCLSLIILMVSCGLMVLLWMLLQG